MIGPKLKVLLPQLSDLTPEELSELQKVVNEHLANHLRNIGANDDLTDDEWRSLDSNNRLSCIKSVRERTGLGLLEASAYVNRARAKRRPSDGNPDDTLAPAAASAATPLLEDSGAGFQRDSAEHTSYCPRGCCDTAQDFGNGGRWEGHK